MNGAKVFEFSLSRIPSLVKEIDFSNGGPHEIYFFIKLINLCLII